MSKSLWGVFGLTLAIGLTLESGSIKAQTNARQNPTTEDSLQPASQQLDYRTPQQIFQRRVNNATITCDASNSASCRQVTPQLESLEENKTLMQIREAREEQKTGDRE